MGANSRSGMTVLSFELVLPPLAPASCMGFDLAAHVNIHLDNRTKRAGHVSRSQLDESAGFDVREEDTNCRRRACPAYHGREAPEDCGYDVIGARDGMGAISSARKEQPDLVLLDLGLPAGDGFVVMQRLQTLLSTATIPIVVLSSRDLANGEEASKRAGAVAYLQKPVDFEKLLKVIVEAIGTPELNP